MPQEIIALASAWSHWAIGSLLVASTLAFIVLFLVPGIRLGSELRRSHKALAELKKADAVLDLAAVEKRAMVSRSLRHCWSEFRDTLHGQKTLGAAGSMEVSRWRATALASTFFSEAVLVDTRVRSEFFKHLPGILTGLGIIGTFSGLILGLQDFRVSDDAATVRNSLQVLLNAVGGAFLVSTAAITLAMLATFIEKVILSRRYADVEQLCSLIDGLFDSGAGEEYLARLVAASETSATQAAHIKDALVSDLKSILTELTERQMATLTASNAQMAQSIGQTLTDSLAEPLREISGAVRQVGGQQGDAVNKLLTDVLASFAARMESMFGGQLSGMNELLKQTADTMNGTAQRFEQLAAKIEQAGSGAADKMAQRMEALLDTMASRQSESNEQMRVFVEQMREMLNKGQSETAELMNSTFAELGQTTSALVQQLQGQAEQSHAAAVRHAQTFAEHTGQAIDRQGEHIGSLTSSVEQAAQTMQAAIERMRTGTDENITRMAAGAERLHGASTTLEGSLRAMSNAADSVDTGIENLSQAAQALNNSLTLTQQALGEQKEVRNALALMVTELRRMVETAGRDASVTAQLVGTLESAAGKLVEAQRQADVYLHGVTETLATAHEQFASHIGSTLQKGNADFHKELARAVDVLRGAIQELGDTLDAVPSRA